VPINGTYGQLSKPSGYIARKDNEVNLVRSRGCRGTSQRRADVSSRLKTHSQLIAGAFAQQAVTTRESVEMKKMVQGQLQREAARKRLSEEEFRQLNLTVAISRVRETRDMFMNRALERLNKTNQFNTTGARYTLERCHQRLTCGYEVHVVHAEDRFTQYGLIGGAWLRGNCVEHLVLSCRVLGLAIEEALLAQIAQPFAENGETTLLGRLVPTEANLACRQVYARTGFVQSESDATLWSRPLAIPFPAM
jgi:FkbH-like protein